MLQFMYLHWMKTIRLSFHFWLTDIKQTEIVPTCKWWSPVNWCEECIHVGTFQNITTSVLLLSLLLPGYYWPFTLPNCVTYSQATLYHNLHNISVGQRDYCLKNILYVGRIRSRWRVKRQILNKYNGWIYVRLFRTMTQESSLHWCTRTRPEWFYAL